MVENKRRKQVRSRTKTKKKKTARKAKVTASSKQSKGRKVSGKKVRPPARKKRASKSTTKEIRSVEPSTLSGETFSAAVPRSIGGRGSISAGQSGDVQGLSRRAIADSESVEELLEEGQAREAAAISGVEDALDPDQSEVRTREVPEDDVPEEYLKEE
jgi:hypothetical protein